MNVIISIDPEGGFDALHGALSRFVTSEVAIYRRRYCMTIGILLDVNDDEIVVHNSKNETVCFPYGTFDEVMYL